MLSNFDHSDSHVCLNFNHLTPTVAERQECPDVKNYKWWLNPVWHMMIYSCTHMATVGVKGLNCYVVVKVPKVDIAMSIVGLQLAWVNSWNACGSVSLWMRCIVWLTLASIVKSLICCCRSLTSTNCLTFPRRPIAVHAACCSSSPSWVWGISRYFTSMTTDVYIYSSGYCTGHKC